MENNVENVVCKTLKGTLVVLRLHCDFLSMMVFNWYLTFTMKAAVKEFRARRLAYEWNVMIVLVV